MSEAPNPIPFWFLRHGETDWNARGLSQGNIDIPLNQVGLAQAERAARALVSQTLSAPIASIVASPLGRAKVTAEIAGAALGLPVEIDEGLREVSFGVEEGQPMGAWYDEWIEGGFTPEGAEPFAALRARAVAAIDRATARPGPVLVVAHGALWRAFRQAANLPANIRTPNALPLWTVPPQGGGAAWTLTPLDLHD